MNVRLMKVLEDERAMSDTQAGNRTSMTPHTHIGLSQNVTKHAHRTGKPLYMMSTDIRKAFDTVSFDAFSFSFQALGFDRNVLDLVDNLQQNFKCSAVLHTVQNLHRRVNMTHMTRGASSSSSVYEPSVPVQLGAGRRPAPSVPVQLGSRMRLAPSVPEHAFSLHLWSRYRSVQAFLGEFGGFFGRKWRFLE